ncbi:hypothetical protein ACM66B_002739 [Microbotryomycetes sp. NB124-2]
MIRKHGMLPLKRLLAGLVAGVIVWSLVKLSRAGPAAVKSQLAPTNELRDTWLDPQEQLAFDLVKDIKDLKYSPEKSTRGFNASVCAVVSHEQQFVPEWLAWHQLQGIQQFYLFDNAPSAEMRRLLRPWLESGVATLVELNYQEGTNIADVWQHTLLRYCQHFAMPDSRWVSHFDVDEFVRVDPPASSAPVPTKSGDGQWRFPLHDRLALLEDANCVPMSRITFQNVGSLDIGATELVTHTHVTRLKAEVSFKTYGKMWLHSNFQQGRASWHGPHSCRPPVIDNKVRPNIVLDSLGRRLYPEDDVYPSEGLPLAPDGIVLNHYLQRSVSDCVNKYNVNKLASRNWRAIDGQVGCARNFVPSDEQLGPDKVGKLLARPHGRDLVSRSKDWDVEMLVDAKARDSWVGRMTKLIVEQWLEDRVGGEWRWVAESKNDREDLDKLENVVISIDV